MSFVDLRPNIEKYEKVHTKYLGHHLHFHLFLSLFAFSIMFMEYIKCIEYSGSQYYCYYYYCPPPSLCLSVSVGRKQTRIVSAVATLSQNNPTWHTVQNEPFTNDVDAMVYICLFFLARYTACAQKPDIYRYIRSSRDRLGFRAEIQIFQLFLPVYFLVWGGGVASCSLIRP